KADEIAHEFDASVESPDVPALLRRAEKLDQVCANLDTQVGLTVQLTQPHPVRSVIDVARAKGFTEYRNGLAWMNHDGLPRFVLLLAGEHAEDPANAGVNRVDLLLDVPCSPPDETPFARMMAVGRDLALSLDGQLIDDSGRPVMEGSEHAIDEQIRGIYEELEQQGLQAGSPRALRVFS
ncbi:MAG: cell division protein ZipA C-terminal FtsZ-binding domain-containing protein, partial [Advenella sp.]